MKWWKKFWRIRKQEDRVKIVLLLFLLGIVFLFYGVYNGICLYQAVQTPVEYVLAGDSGEQNLGRKLNEIREWENMAGASIFRESSVLITYQGEETTFSCVELSEEYIKDVYGISQSGATKTFYMNQKAFDMVKETNEAFSYKQSGSEDTLRMTYETEEAEEGQTQLPEKERKEKKTAEIVRVKEGVNEEEPFVFSAGEKGILIKYGMGIRVCFKGQDMDGSQLRKIQEAGLTVENMQVYQELEHLREGRELHIKYAVGLSIICLFCACILWKTSLDRVLEKAESKGNVIPNPENIKESKKS